jgi:hypothetical protein
MGEAGRKTNLSGFTSLLVFKNRAESSWERSAFSWRDLGSNPVSPIAGHLCSASRFETCRQLLISNPACWAVYQRSQQKQ